MRNEITFFNKSEYIKMCHNKFNKMGKNLYLIESCYCPKGKSFIRNITDVINSRASYQEKGQYVYLASLRNYIDVLMKNSFELDRSLVPEVPSSVFETNRLVRLNDGKIYFYFEDKLNGY